MRDEDESPVRVGAGVADAEVGSSVRPPPRPPFAVSLTENVAAGAAALRRGRLHRQSKPGQRVAEPPVTMVKQPTSTESGAFRASASLARLSSSLTRQRPSARASSGAPRTGHPVPRLREDDTVL